MGDNVVARTALGRPHRLVVAGHLDTVPAGGQRARRGLEGDVLWGVGCGRHEGRPGRHARPGPHGRTSPAVDVTWCFYACEEVGRDRERAGRSSWRDRPELLAADAAVLGEPTDGRGGGRLPGDDAGGGPRGRRSGPTPPGPSPGATPSTGWRPVLDRVAEWEGRSVVLDGCEYVEQLQAVGGRGRGGRQRRARPRHPHRSTTASPPTGTPRRPAVPRRPLRRLARRPSSATGRRWWTRPTARRRRSTIRCWPRWSPAPAQPAAGQGRAGPTWPRSWPTGSRRPTSGPGDPLLAHHPDERVDRGAPRARPRQCSKPCCCAGPADRSEAVAAQTAAPAGGHRSRSVARRAEVAFLGRELVDPAVDAGRRWPAPRRR